MILFGPSPGCRTMPSASASSISSSAAGISSRRSRQTILTSRAPIRSAESDISPADYNHLLADGELVSEIHVQKEINSLVNAVEIYAGNTQVATAVGANREQNRVESLVPQIGEVEVASRCMIQLQREVSRFEDLAYLRFHHVAWQTIFGDTEVEHSSRNWGGFEDCHRISQQREVVR